MVWVFTSFQVDPEGPKTPATVLSVPCPTGHYSLILAIMQNCQYPVLFSKLCGTSVHSSSVGFCQIQTSQASCNYFLLFTGIWMSAK